MDKNFYITLIYKQLKGLITAEELKQLNEWEATNEQNRSEADAIRQTWEMSADYELPFELDYDADFQKVHQKIEGAKAANSDQKENTPSIAPDTQNKSNRRLWWSIAAGLALLITAGFLINNFLNQSTDSWQTITAENEIKQIELPDGTKVKLNLGSSLSYLEGFKGDNRNVKLKGEAFFKVTKDPNRPFVVSSDDLNVTVLGTAFNVRDLGENDDAVVAVQEGKVRVENKDQAQQVILTANQTAFIQNKKLQKQGDQNLNQIAWHRESFRFKSVKLSEVIRDISNHYQVEIEIDNPFMEDCAITGSFNTETTIEKLLNAITSVHKIEVNKSSDKSFLLIGGTCENNK